LVCSLWFYKSEYPNRRSCCWNKRKI